MEWTNSTTQDKNTAFNVLASFHTAKILSRYIQTVWFYFMLSGNMAEWTVTWASQGIMAKTPEIQITEVPTD